MNIYVAYHASCNSTCQSVVDFCYVPSEMSCGGGLLARASQHLAWAFLGLAQAFLGLAQAFQGLALASQGLVWTSQGLDLIFQGLARAS